MSNTDIKNTTNGADDHGAGCGDVEGKLPPELAALALELDRLGAFERSGVPAGCVERVASASASVLAGDAIANWAGELDRGAADAGLEARVYETSRDRIGAETHAGGLRLVGGTRHRRAGRGWKIGLACAAMLGLASVGVLVLRPMTTGTQLASNGNGGGGTEGETTGLSASELAQQIDGDFELLFASFGGDTGHVKGLSSTDESETGMDPLLFDDVPMSGGTM